MTQPKIGIDALKNLVAEKQIRLLELQSGNQYAAIFDKGIFIRTVTEEINLLKIQIADSLRLLETLV